MTPDFPPVLLLDDDRITLAALSRLCQELGYEVHRTQSLAEAQRMLREIHFPVCLVDMHLSLHARGTFLIEWARRENLETEFIVVSGTDRREDVIQALRAGAFDFVEKPADPVLVSRALTRAADTVANRRKVARQAKELEALNEDLERTVHQRTEKMLEQWQVTNEILSSLPIGLLRIDAGWNVDYVNPKAEQILGQARAQLVGPIYRAPALAPFFEALKQASDEGRWGFARPLSFRRPGGRAICVDYRLVLLRPTSETFRGAVVLMEELSEEVRQSRELARAMTPDAVGTELHDVTGTPIDMAGGIL